MKKPAFSALTLSEARKITTWFQKVMRLRDWKFDIWVQQEPPAWASARDEPGHRPAGCSLSEIRFKHARVWVSNQRCNGEYEAVLVDPYRVMVHELLHAGCEEAGIKRHAAERGEFFMSGLERLVLYAYRKGVEAE